MESHLVHLVVLDVGSWRSYEGGNIGQRSFNHSMHASIACVSKTGSEHHVCLDEPYENHDPDLSTTTLVHDAIHILSINSLYPIQWPFEHGRQVSFNNKN